VSSPKRRPRLNLTNLLNGTGTLMVAKSKPFAVRIISIARSQVDWNSGTTLFLG
jgi:hypothetical protein